MPKHMQAPRITVTVAVTVAVCKGTYAQAYAGPVADVAAGHDSQATRSAQSSGGKMLTLTLAGTMGFAGLSTDGSMAGTALNPRPASCCCMALSREEMALTGWDIHSTQWCSSGRCRCSCI